LKKYAQEQEDWPENKPFAPGVKRGKVFIPKEEPVVQEEGEDVILDVEEEGALKSATDADLVDLAGILGFHSMLNQEQYYAAITLKGQKNEGGTFQSIAKAPVPKIVPALPDNDTDVTKTAQQVVDNDPKLKELNWNNIKHIPRDTFKKLFDGLKTNTYLEKLHISNTGLTDGPTAHLVQSLKANKTLTVLDMESNFISGVMIKNLVESLNENQTMLEFRATNQRPQILGNRIEMAIAKLIELNSNLLRLGLNFDVPDARMRIAQRLQTNNDSVRLQRIGRTSSVEA
jgi:tropomodulin